MKAISVYDLKLVSTLAHLNYFEMVSPDYDHLVLPVLEELGFDLEYPLMYTTSQHRTLANKVVIGYVIRGEVSVNRKHLTSVWATVYDKLVAASYYDQSLCIEMASLMNNSLDYAAFNAEKADTKIQDYSIIESEEERYIVEQIALLEKLLYEIRGNQYKQDGGYKMAIDYHVEEPKIQFRTKRRKLKNV
jgi:predicted transcriptional regulator YdeE